MEFSLEKISDTPDFEPYQSPPSGIPIKTTTKPVQVIAETETEFIFQLTDTAYPELTGDNDKYFEYKLTMNVKVGDEIKQTKDIKIVILPNESVYILDLYQTSADEPREYEQLFNTNTDTPELGVIVYKNSSSTSWKMGMKGIYGPTPDDSENTDRGWKPDIKIKNGNRPWVNADTDHQFVNIDSNLQLWSPGANTFHYELTSERDGRWIENNVYEVQIGVADGPISDSNNKNNYISDIVSIFIKRIPPEPTITPTLTNTPTPPEPTVTPTLTITPTPEASDDDS